MRTAIEAFKASGLVPPEDSEEAEPEPLAEEEPPAEEEPLAEDM
jgi:hypothetical protein